MTNGHNFKVGDLLQFFLMDNIKLSKSFLQMEKNTAKMLVRMITQIPLPDKKRIKEEMAYTLRKNLKKSRLYRKI
ncbi:MAG: hypothetical protein K2M59_06890 [Muribaculaceae bacterium]|nr:hypothetical protein [Muribaculaceae bacterium]